jgi:hypothetical protein
MTTSSSVARDWKMVMNSEWLQFWNEAVNDYYKALYWQLRVAVAALSKA